MVWIWCGLRVFLAYMLIFDVGTVRGCICASTLIHTDMRYCMSNIYRLDGVIYKGDSRGYWCHAKLNSSGLLGSPLLAKKLSLTYLSV